MRRQRGRGGRGAHADLVTALADYLTLAEEEGR